MVVTGFTLRTLASVEHKLASFHRAFCLFEEIIKKKNLNQCDEYYKREAHESARRVSFEQSQRKDVFTRGTICAKAKRQEGV